uniref:Uncharacterized protein n=1 Tax=Chromera velia CCMP2878 TaxID=1169474 RepID=A0A0G4FHA8_9ALVE|eukprot:Cvel_17003.t1-p1 / transcript=Cvel_17003.t1 / gene=Cvel_17003 / organism=Chromera_velia_CCMP2878 / gene_product=hypothetical protein / transcript_product=hypothetical protein / location=Cvel_scaffold1336:22468-26007(-) / protein_length=775 / sequence_SO=supercontig / SO=protein_coding / is_pseudo=false
MTRRHSNRATHGGALLLSNPFVGFQVEESDSDDQDIGQAKQNDASPNSKRSPTAEDFQQHVTFRGKQQSPSARGTRPDSQQSTTPEPSPQPEQNGGRFRRQNVPDLVSGASTFSDDTTDSEDDLPAGVVPLPSSPSPSASRNRHRHPFEFSAEALRTIKSTFFVKQESFLWHNHAPASAPSTSQGGNSKGRSKDQPDKVTTDASAPDETAVIDMGPMLVRADPRALKRHLAVVHGLSGETIERLLKSIRALTSTLRASSSASAGGGVGEPEGDSCLIEDSSGISGEGKGVSWEAFLEALQREGLCRDAVTDIALFGTSRIRIRHVATKYFRDHTPGVPPFAKVEHCVRAAFPDHEGDLYCTAAKDGVVGLWEARPEFGSFGTLSFQAANLRHRQEARISALRQEGAMRAKRETEKARRIELAMEEMVSRAGALMARARKKEAERSLKDRRTSGLGGAAGKLAWEVFQKHQQSKKQQKTGTAPGGGAGGNANSAEGQQALEEEKEWQERALRGVKFARLRFKQILREIRESGKRDSAMLEERRQLNLLVERQREQDTFFPQVNQTAPFGQQALRVKNVGFAAPFLQMQALAASRLPLPDGSVLDDIISFLLKPSAADREREKERARERERERSRASQERRNMFAEKAAKVVVATGGNEATPRPPSSQRSVSTIIQAQPQPSKVSQTANRQSTGDPLKDNDPSQKHQQSSAVTAHESHQPSNKRNLAVPLLDFTRLPRSPSSLNGSFRGPSRGATDRRPLTSSRRPSMQTGASRSAE